jgi:hypothetical protein
MAQDAEHADTLALIAAAQTHVRRARRARLMVRARFTELA